MFRHLLTLLALCAGFAAIGTPVRAAQVVQAAQQAASVTVSAAPAAVTRLIGAAPSSRLPAERPVREDPAGASLPAPAIRLQADRAHE